MDEDFSKSINTEIDKIEKAIDSQSKESIIILQAHLFAENSLDEIILNSLKRGDILLNNNFSFLQKLYIVQAIDILKPETVETLKILNKYRNKIAHELNYCISEKDIDLLGSPSGKNYKKFKEKKVRLEYIIYVLIANLHIKILDINNKK